MADITLSDRELVGILEAHRLEALGYYNDELTSEQRENLKRYLGWPYGDEVEGRSAVVSEDAAQVVDWTIPDLLEPFVSGEMVVEFLPTRPGDEEAEVAQQATDYVNFIFYKDNPGYDILYAAAKDGLIQKFGVTKACWTPCKKTEEETVTGINLAALQELRDDEDVEITEQSSEAIDIEIDDELRANATDQELVELAEQMEGLRRQFPDGKSYDVTFERTIDRSYVELMPVPPEEFRVSPRQAVLANVPYCAHEAKRTRSDLIEMDFDADIVNDLPPYAENADWTRDEQIRFWNEQRGGETTTKTTDTSQDEILLLEEYIQADVDGDGDTEWAQVFRVNDQVLSKEIVEEHPFEGFCPMPIPHKVIGQSLVDKMRQTQRIKTVLTRQMLDNVYLANNPQREVPEAAVTDDGSTYDDLLTFRVGGLVRTKEGGQIREMAIPDRSDTALKAIGYFDQVREMDTGAVRGSAGMSSEAIDTTQPITAEEARRTSRAQLKRTRMMARTFAESYLAPLMGKVYRLVTKYQDFERMIRLRKDFVAMDPRSWNRNMDVEANVGLGFPNREERVAVTDGILARQVQGMEMGLSSPAKIFNTLEMQVEASGLGDAEKFYIDPDSDEGKALAEQRKAQPEQDPAAQKAQQDMQINAAKTQQELQLNQAKAQQQAQLQSLEMQRKSQLEAMKLRQQGQIDLMKIQAQMAADQEQAQAQFALDARQAQQQHELDIAKMEREFALAIRRVLFEEDMAEREAATGLVTNFRPGGNLAA